MMTDEKAALVCVVLDDLAAPREPIKALLTE